MMINQLWTQFWTILGITPLEAFQAWLFWCLVVFLVYVSLGLLHHHRNPIEWLKDE
jgi:hypothetical protein